MLSNTSVHSLHPYVWCRLVFLRVKERVAKVPFPFDGLSSGLETLMGAINTELHSLLLSLLSYQFPMEEVVLQEYQYRQFVHPP